jgi:hypothetical protein
MVTASSGEEGVMPRGVKPVFNCDVHGDVISRLPTAMAAAQKALSPKVGATPFADAI